MRKRTRSRLRHVIAGKVKAHPRAEIARAAMVKFDELPERVRTYLANSAIGFDVSGVWHAHQNGVDEEQMLRDMKDREQEILRDRKRARK